MKLAIISGASAGIGAATAHRLAADDWTVLNLSRRPCPVEGVEHLPCDFSDSAALAAILPRLTERVQAATRTLLVHNASLLRNDRSGETAVDAFAEVLQVNLAAPNAINNAVLPHLKEGSAVIYVGSTLSEKAVPGAFSYVTTKHATIGMMRATCQDLAGRGIHTACVCPGFTDTEMLREHVGTDPETRAAIGAMTAFGRLIEPEEIAETIVWAALHPVMNGAVIHANLGQVER
ncbi:MAG: SDR family oxidoreductase [Pseudomonadales bacterium]|nr:SDR family oxidoreductase [Pseudomonadales bacterium]